MTVEEPPNCGHVNPMVARARSIAVAALGVTFLFLRVDLARGQQGLPYQSHPDLTIPPSRSQGQTMELKSQRHPEADALLSSKASDYLHEHRLPFVSAQVFRDTSGRPESVVLTGRVRTQFGKQDAERKVGQFLNASVHFDNQLSIEPSLSVPLGGQPLSATTIPEAFFGCWLGSSSNGHYGALEPGYQYLGGCPRGVEVPSTSELCIAKTQEGGFEITSQAASAPLPNFRSHTDLTSSNGSIHINFRTASSYDMSGGGGLFGLAGSDVTVAGSSGCDLLHDASVLSCDESDLYSCNGLPWYRYNGHSDMHRTK